MTDREKDLYERMSAAFTAEMEKDKQIEEFAEKADKGIADYEDAWAYADRIGEIASKVAQEYAQEIVDIADGYEAVRDYLVNNCFENAADYAVRAQEILNEQSGLGIAAQKPPMNTNMASGIASRASNSVKAEAARIFLGEAVINFTGSAVGDTLEKNAKLLNDAGIRSKVRRTAEYKCCKWCSSLAGVYTSPDIPKDVFKRHNNCRCTVTYDGKNLKAYRSKSGKENTFRVQTNGLGTGYSDEDIPEHPKPERLRKIDVSSRKEIDNAIKEFEKATWEANTENALVITKTGDMFWCYGNEDRVWPDKDLGLPILKDAIVAHNHPAAATSFTFGSDDLGLFDVSGMAELYGVDYKYTYSIKRNGEKTKEMTDFDTSKKGALHYYAYRFSLIHGFKYERRER